MTVGELIAYALAAFAIVLTGVQIISIILAFKKCHRGKRPVPVPADAPPVTIVRPLCGLDAYELQTMRSGFLLDYPRYEIIFCVADANDPVIALAQRTMAEFRHIPSRLIIGDVKISQNPKLNNCVRGWEEAQYDWIILADSNVLMPQDYIQRMLKTYSVKKTGLVCSCPIGIMPDGFWAEWECAFLNTFQARWQYAGDSVSSGFAQGKSMLWRKEILERDGGIRALARDIAEDAASTKVVREQGLHVRLVDGPFEQPLGKRSAASVWGRQLRWARLRRITFPLFFVPEIVSTSFFPTLAAFYAAETLGYYGWLVALGVMAIWFGSEAVLAYVAGWHWSPRMWLALFLRDLASPVLWIEAWRSKGFVWRGNVMTVDNEEEEPGEEANKIASGL